MPIVIDVFAAPADKFFVNSFIIESDEAVVVVDTQFLMSTASALADVVAAKRKPLAGIVITHPHPDHFNGLPILLDRFGSVPVYANRATTATIAATQTTKRAAWTPVYGSDYPTKDALPDTPISADETFDVGGVTLRSLDLGPGESADITVLHIPAADALIVSDLIYNECHPWLAEHRTNAWLSQLTDVETRFQHVTRIYPGHGPAAGRELFRRQRDYILEQRDTVAKHARNGVLDETGLGAVRESARRGREEWPLEGLIDMNSKAIAAELAEASP